MLAKMTVISGYSYLPESGTMGGRKLVLCLSARSRSVRSRSRKKLEKTSSLSCHTVTAPLCAVTTMDLAG